MQNTMNQNIPANVKNFEAIAEERNGENVVLMSAGGGMLGAVAGKYGSKGFMALAEKMTKVSDEAQKNVDTVLSNAKTVSSESKKVTDTMTPLAENLGQAVDELQTKAAQATVVTEGTARLTNNLGGRMGQNANTLNNLGNDLGAAKSAFDQATQNMQNSPVAAQDALKKGVDQVNNAARNVENIARKTIDTSQQIRSAGGQVRDATNAVSDAAQVVADAAPNVDASVNAMKDGAKNIDEASKELNKNITNTEFKHAGKIAATSAIIASLVFGGIAAVKAVKNREERVELQTAAKEMAAEEAALIQENTAMKQGVMQQNAMINELAAVNQQQAQALAQVAGPHAARLGGRAQDNGAQSFVDRVGGSQARDGAFADRVAQQGNPAMSRSEMVEAARQAGSDTPHIG